jgi:hypothetical protein
MENPVKKETVKSLLAACRALGQGPRTPLYGLAPPQEGAVRQAEAAQGASKKIKKARG